MNLKSIFCTLLAALALCACASTKGFVKNPERLKAVKRVAVLPFVCNSRELGYAISEALSARLLLSRYTVIERAQFEKLLSEQGLTLSGVLEDQGPIIGRIKGVDAIIVGSATADRGFAGLAYGGYKDYVSTANARMIDLITGEVLIAATFSASGASTMSGVTTPNDVGENLANEMSSH
jgi:curli biogenesis system outer membrane secretion channel CsgG